MTTAIKTGLLTKRGGKVKNWKSRHFVLSERTLSYYRSQDPRALPAGSIDLVSAIDVCAPAEADLPKYGCDKKFKATQVIIVKTSIRDYVLVAKDTVDRDEWLTAIKTTFVARRKELDEYLKRTAFSAPQKPPPPPPSQTSAPESKQRPARKKKKKAAPSKPKIAPPKFKGSNKLFETGTFYFDKGYYQEAISWYERARKDSAQRFGQQSRSVGYALNRIGLAQEKLELFDDALTNLGQASVILVETRGLEHEHTANVYASLGRIYLRCEDYENAKTFLSAALGVSQKVAGGKATYPVALNTAMVAHVHYLLGDANAALQFCLTAKALFGKVLGEESAAVAVEFLRMATISMNLVYNYSAAKGLLAKLLEIKEKNWLPAGFETVDIWLDAQLTLLAIYEDNIDEAEHHARHALATETDDNVGNSIAFRISALIAFERKQFDEAHRLLDEADEEVTEHHLGDANHPSLHACFNSITRGNFYHRQPTPDLPQALRCYEKALDHLKRLYLNANGKCLHPFASGVYDVMGEVYTKMGNHAKASACQQMLKEICTKYDLEPPAPLLRRRRYLEHMQAKEAVQQQQQLQLQQQRMTSSSNIGKGNFTVPGLFPDCYSMVEGVSDGDGAATKRTPLEQLRIERQLYSKEPLRAQRLRGMELYYFTGSRIDREMRLLQSGKTFTDLNFLGPDTTSSSAKAFKEAKSADGDANAVYGVSAAFLVDFCEQKLGLRETGTSTEYASGVLNGVFDHKIWTVHDVNKEIVLPETQALNCSYAELLEGKVDPLTERPLVGKATVFVSHAWGSDFLCSVNTMLDFAKQNPDSYFWFDLFMNNQHNTAEVPQEWWSTTFRDSIRAIGQVLLVLTPWNSPLPLTRSWCLWEIKCAIEFARDDGIDFTIGMPPSHKLHFRLHAQQDVASVVQALAASDAEKAQATNPRDQEMIQNNIRQGIGFAKLNDIVKKAMLGWFHQELRAFATAKVDETLGDIEHVKDPVNASRLDSHVFGTMENLARVAMVLFSTFGDADTAARLLTVLIELGDAEHDKCAKVIAELEEKMQRMPEASDSVTYGRTKEELQLTQGALRVHKHKLAELCMLQSDVLQAVGVATEWHHVKKALGYFGTTIDGSDIVQVLTKTTADVIGDKFNAHLRVLFSHTLTRLARVFASYRSQVEEAVTCRLCAVELYTAWFEGSVSSTNASDPTLRLLGLPDGSTMDDILDQILNISRLGELMLDLNDKGQAEKALDIASILVTACERLFSESHQDTINAYTLLARAHRQLGDAEKAEQFEQKVLKSEQHIFGASHIKVGLKYQEQGIQYREDNKPEQALASFDKALAIFKDCEPSKDIQFPLMTLSTMYEALGNLDRAVECALLVYTMFVESGEDDSFLGTQAKVISHLYEKLGQKDKAEEWLQKVPESERGGMFDDIWSNNES